MSNEVRVNFNLNVVNGSYKETFNNNGAFDQSAQGAEGAIVSVPTTGVDIDITGVTTAGFLFLLNLDDANYVDYGVDSGALTLVPFGRIKPGEYHWLRLYPGIALMAKANTATVKLQYYLLED